PVLMSTRRRRATFCWVSSGGCVVAILSASERLNVSIVKSPSTQRRRNRGRPCASVIDDVRCFSDVLVVAPSRLECTPTSLASMLPRSQVKKVSRGSTPGKSGRGRWVVDDLLGPFPDPALATARRTVLLPSAGAVAVRDDLGLRLSQSLGPGQNLCVRAVSC